MLLFAFGVMAAGVVVHRIKTDTGEFVVETEDPDVEVAVKQGGRLVTIYDPKSGQKLILNSGEYDFEINGKPAGLKLDIEKATLKRGDVIVARIRKEPRNTNETPTTIRPPNGTKPTVGPIQLIERKSILHPGNLYSLAFDSAGQKLALNGESAGLYLAETGEKLKDSPHAKIRLVSISPDGKRFAVYTDAKSEGHVVVMNAVTGEETHRFGPFRYDSSWVCHFASNGEDLLIGQDEFLHRAKLKTGKIEKIVAAPQFTEMRFADPSPDGRKLAIPDTAFDLVGRREAVIRIVEYAMPSSFPRRWPQSKAISHPPRGTRSARVPSKGNRRRTSLRR